MGDIEYTIHEKPVSAETEGISPKRENPRQVNPKQAKPVLGKPEQENPAQLNTDSTNTEKINKDRSRTHQSIYPAKTGGAAREDWMDRIDLVNAYRNIIQDNIEYDFLIDRYGKERLDETVELMLETVLSSVRLSVFAEMTFRRRSSKADS